MVASIAVVLIRQAIPARAQTLSVIREARVDHIDHVEEFMIQANSTVNAEDQAQQIEAINSWTNRH
jgi:hypothetical protein